MARINIEDSLFKDKRYERLLIMTGDGRIAKGALVEAFMLAQEFFQNETSDGLIPSDVWNRSDMHESLITSGCAEVREKGIYVMGSKSNFTWLKQKKEAGTMISEKKLNALAENRKKRWANKKKPSEENQNGSERASEKYQNTRTTQNGSKPPTLTLPPPQEGEEYKNNSSDIPEIPLGVYVPDIQTELEPDEISNALSSIRKGIAPFKPQIQEGA